MDERLSPGWLARDLAEAPSDIASKHSPLFVRATVLRDSMLPPLSAVDAQKLRGKLSDRYHAWTGRDLGDDLASDVVPSPPSSTTLSEGAKQ